jgi:hypothetical protein
VIAFEFPVYDTLKETCMTFDDLAALEPRLRGLVTEAAENRRANGPGTDSDYSRFKLKLLTLVGFERAAEPDRPLGPDHPLRSEEGYRVALNRLVEALEF